LQGLAGCLALSELSNENTGESAEWMIGTYEWMV